LHAEVRVQRYDGSATFRWNGASFYDLFGPTHQSRKGYATRLAWHRTVVRDAPRTLDLTVSLSHYGGLEQLPDAQNVAVSAGFDQLVGGEIELRYRHLRSSIGAVDYERGHQWRLATNWNGVRFRRAGGARWRGFPFAEGGLDVGRPLPIRNASAWLRTAAGLSPGERDEPFANFFFGGFGNNYVDRLDPKRYRDPESFPGVPIDALAGTRFVKGLLDLNLPALRFRRAGTLALYASWARISLFGGGIVTNPDDAATRRRIGHAGAQVDVRFQLLTQQPLTLSFGYARAFERAAPPRHEGMASLKIL
jgi:hypothetical protein